MMDASFSAWMDSHYEVPPTSAVPAPSPFIPSPAMYQASQHPGAQDSFLGHLAGHMHTAPHASMSQEYTSSPIYDYSMYSQMPPQHPAPPVPTVNPLDASERAAVLEVLRMQCERLHLVLEMERLAQQERVLLAACQRQGLSIPGMTPAAPTTARSTLSQIPASYSHDAYAASSYGYQYAPASTHPHQHAFTPASYPTGPSLHSASAMSMSSLASTPATSPAPSERSSPARDTPTRQGSAPASTVVFTMAMSSDVFVNAAKEQSACRSLQAALEIADPAFVAHVLHAVLPTAAELMMDPFGNYLMQKLMDVLDEPQRAALLEAVAPDLVEVAQNMHGTRAVQRLADVLRNDVAAGAFCEAVAPHAVALSKDLNASHAVQRVIAVIPSPCKDVVVASVLENLMDIACNRQGCCVVQRCIDHGCPAQRQAIIAASLERASNLVTDPFGNYVIQYLLDQHGAAVVCQISAKIAPMVSTLACNKFSSNVIEKCLRAAPSCARSELINGLCEPGAMQTMLHDGFANYVVQTALKTCNSTHEIAQLAQAVRPHLAAIRGTPHGKNIEMWLSKNTNEDGSVVTTLRGTRAVYSMEDDEAFAPQPGKGRGRPANTARIEDSVTGRNARRQQNPQRRVSRQA